MFPVSTQFKTDIYGNSRMNKGRVTFDLSDINAASDVSSIVVTSENVLSNKAQMNDKIRYASNKLATNEQNRFALDGSWSFADSTLSNNGEIGWVSDLICDGTGTFTTPQLMTFNFGSVHSAIGLTITFDAVVNEYATDFTMIAYDASNVVLATYPFTGNTLSQVGAYGNLVNFKKVVVQINKWSVPNRRARVAEVDFGIVQVYTGESGLIRMSLIEELDLTSGTLPSPEFKFTVDNSSRQFNILNPTGFFKSLQQRQQVVGEIGLVKSDGSTEWVQVGNYLLNEWQSDEGSLTATFFARTKLDLMASVNYSSLVATSISLGALATNIFALCGVTNYSIDPALNSITTNGLVNPTNCKEVLQMIAVAGGAVVYVTRSNIITLKVLPLPTVSIDTISMDDQYQEPKINLDAITKTVQVTYWTNLSTSGISTVNSSAVNGDTFALTGNTLINTAAQATVVANWIMAQKNNRAIYTINWRGNQSQELADIVAIGNSYGSPINAYITRSELKYEGYVQATTEAKGAAN